jgi:DNA-binding HxlR family transcriptional regulator
MREDQRSACPINLALEVFGDRWSLLIIRDIIFAGKRHFREFLSSDEKISTRILSDRLASLVSHGVLTKTDDPAHKQKAIYSLTEMGIALLPILAQVGIWGREYCPVTDQSAANAARLKRGGPELLKQMMIELRRIHLHGASSLHGARAK